MCYVHSGAFGSSSRINVKINAFVLPYVLWFRICKILAMAREHGSFIWDEGDRNSGAVQRPRLYD
jgi:hypothetical protein